MNEKINLKIRGEVTIIDSSSKVVLQEANAISADALEVLLNCMSNVPNEAHIDSIVMIGTFGQISKGVTNSILDPVEKSITFITQAFENDFNGTLESLRLEMGVMGLVFATKTGLSIEKDNETRVEVRWKITLNNC